MTGNDNVKVASPFRMFTNLDVVKFLKYMLSYVKFKVSFIYSFVFHNSSIT